MQRKEGGGTTIAARIKALLLHVQRRHGRADADAFLLKTRLDREYIDDETRPIPLERWHAALVALEAMADRLAAICEARRRDDPGAPGGDWIAGLLAAGCDDYCPKPIDRNELFRILAVWLSAQGANSAEP